MPSYTHRKRQGLAFSALGLAALCTGKPWHRSRICQLPSTLMNQTSWPQSPRLLQSNVESLKNTCCHDSSNDELGVLHPTSNVTAPAQLFPWFVWSLAVVTSSQSQGNQTPAFLNLPKMNSPWTWRMVPVYGQHAMAPVWGYHNDGHLCIPS